MAARSPRKVFAKSFVVTLAATGACFTESAPPPQQPQQPQPQPVVQQPPPEQKPDVTVVTNPPHPTTTPASPGSPAKPATFDYDQKWTVMKSGDKCSAMARVECPKPDKPGGPVPTCNPPPPMKIECPKDWDGKQALTVVQYAHNEKCEVERAPMKCPKGAMCNPPPPRYVACPTWQ